MGSGMMHAVSVGCEHMFENWPRQHFDLPPGRRVHFAIAQVPQLNAQQYCDDASNTPTSHNGPKGVVGASVGAGLGASVGSGLGGVVNAGVVGAGLGASVGSGL